MAQPHEWMFYEVMWRMWTTQKPYPLPWWIQQYFRQWSDQFDRGLFDSKEAAFASNANYRYWNMIGVKDHHQESLIGQAGEIEPVYDKYALTFFLFDKTNKQLYFPQFPSHNPTEASLEQSLLEDYLPLINTTYRSPIAVNVAATAFATVTEEDAKSVAVAQYTVSYTGNKPSDEIYFGIAVLPTGPTGFQRRDKAGHHIHDNLLTRLFYDTASKHLQVNSSNGPLFNKAPQNFGLYGNGTSDNPDHYLEYNPFQALIQHAALNQRKLAEDQIAGLCHGAFIWKMNFSETATPFILEVKLPVDDFRGRAELIRLNRSKGAALKKKTIDFWQNKLNQMGMQFELPSKIAHLKDLYRTCRANLLILSDDGQIHPGPTVYDSFWIRDSAIEGIAAALAGDFNLTTRQFGYHYPHKFNLYHEWIGPVSTYGLFGGEQEKKNREWDSNGEALWAIGRFDRINNPQKGFGSSMYYPYILLGARWLRDNRSAYGILHSGWSAEHLGDRNQPHYWDDLWGIAGLYEAARLAERINARESEEIWYTYHSLREATANSIRWVLTEQQKQGHWETFIPTGPGDVGRRDSTMIGALAYFHPCRLHMGNKLGAEIDQAARMTLETIWEHFMDRGGFRHDSAWYCYGSYLTMQLAHAFLFIGDRKRMDICLDWCVHAANPRVNRTGTPEQWAVTRGAWNEQHCYPIAKDFAEFPNRPWYMGDIPHGWACAEYLLLLRDILFFEEDEDKEPYINIAPGILPHWLEGNETIKVRNAPTIFGTLFGYELTHYPAEKKIEITITQMPQNAPAYRFSCPFGNGITTATTDGTSLTRHKENGIIIPPGAKKVYITYS